MNCRRACTLATLAAAAGLASPGALAEGAYITFGLAGTTIESDGLVDALASVGLGASSELDDTAFGFQLGAGYMFTDVFGVEIKYSDSGDGEETILITDGIDTVPIDFEASLDGFTLYGVAQTRFAEKWDVFGKLGYTSQDGEIKASAFGLSESLSDDDDGFAVAGGFRFHMTPNWALTGELEYFAIDFDSSFQEPVRGSINLQYLFAAPGG